MRVAVNLGPKISALARARASAIVRATALGIEGDAKTRVRVDTGELRDSIHTETDGDLRAAVGTNVAHGPPNEYGTARMAAQPFLTPAAEAARPGFAAAMTRILD